MKRLLIGFTLLFAIFGLAACDGGGRGLDGGQDTTAEIVAILEDAGYELTEHDADARTYFSENTLGDLGLDITATAFYIGYQDGDNWVQVIGLDDLEDASSVYDAFTGEDDEGQLVYQDGNTVVLTYTQATRDLFE